MEGTRLYDLEAKSFTKVLHEERGCRWPLWKPDGKGFYYVGEHARGSNLFVCDFSAKFRKQLTQDGLYKIWPAKPFAPGEYAVVEYTPGKVNMQVWDFAIQPADK